MFGRIWPRVDAPSSAPKGGSIGAECGDAAGAAVGLPPAVDTELAEMRQCLKRLWVLYGEKRLDRDCAHFASLYELSTAACEAADADGCRGAADTACSLCFVLDRMVRPDRKTLAAIEGHIGILEEMFQDGRWQEIESGGGKVAGWLAELRAAAGVAGIAEPSHGMGAREGG